MTCFWKDMERQRQKSIPLCWVLLIKSNNKNSLICVCFAFERPHWPFKLCSAATFDSCSEDLCEVCSQPPLFMPGFVFCSNATDSGCKRDTFIWKKHICGRTRAIKLMVILTLCVCVCVCIDPPRPPAQAAAVCGATVPRRARLWLAPFRPFHL